MAKKGFRDKTQHSLVDRNIYKQSRNNADQNRLLREVFWWGERSNETIFFIKDKMNQRII